MTDARSFVCPVLVARDDLLALADRRLAEARGGRGGLLFLAGEAGIGKTRLTHAIAGRAAAEGFAVRRSSAFPRDAETTGGMLVDLARELARDGMSGDAGSAIEARLAAMPNADDGPPGDAHRRRRILVLDVVDVLAALPAVTGGSPVLLVMEDLHWADELTLEVLATLARRLPSLPFMVLGTYRSDELYPRVPMREWRARLLTARLAEEARVGRLDWEAIATMTTLLQANGLPAERALVDAVQARSDGVPLHVEEILALLRETADAAATPSPGAIAAGIPDTLADAILRRASGLSRAARAAADAAAVIGRSFDPDLLEAVLDRPVDRVAGDIAELEARFIVTHARDESRLDFRHALIRDALYAQVPGPKRRRLHGRVADAVLTSGRFESAFLSVHLEAAGRGPAAFDAAVDAARHAVSLSAHREARGLLERALRTAPKDLAPVRLAEVLEALADEAAAVDDNEAADRAYAEAAARYATAGEAVRAAALVPRHVAVRHLLGDTLEDRERRLDAARSALDTVPDDDARRAAQARLLAGLAAASMLDRRLEQAIAYGEDGARMAADTGDRAVELDIAATVGACLVFAGRMDDGWTRLEDAIGRSQAEGREAEAARAYRMMGSAASVLVEYERAEHWLREGIAFAEQVELWNHRHYMAAHLAHVAWATGEWADAERFAGQALADGRGGITTRITALYVLGYVFMGRGDLERAQALLDEARVHGEHMAELQRISPALWGLAEVARLRGDLAGAAAWCERGEAASAVVADAAYLFPFLVTGTRVRIGIGDPAGAAEWVERVASVLVRRSIPGTLPAIEHARGLVDLARGATGQARARLEHAATGWRSRHRAWEGMWAMLDLATVHARSGRPAEAVRLAEAVREQAAALGASQLEHEAESRLRRDRGRVVDAVAWAPLTPRELEVARRIATGRTNAAIAAELGVSPRTVDSHVEHILAKLGVARRAEVAAWVVAVAGPPEAGPDSS